MAEREPNIKGGYFPYCEWCERDGKCELTHNEFFHGKNEVTEEEMGASGVDCNGRIIVTNNPFFPLGCSKANECGERGLMGILSYPYAQAFGVMCTRFEPNEAGVARIEKARKLSVEQGVELGEVFDQLEPPGKDYDSIIGP
jgi:hypothetical protein